MLLKGLKMSNALKNFTERVVAALEESEKDQKLKWTKNWRVIDTGYRNYFTQHKYSGTHNILTCLLEGREDCRYASFNQIQKNKFKLKKESKSTRLIAWNITTKKDEKTGKNKKLIFAKEVCVFNIQDIEGIVIKPINNDIFDASIKPNEEIMKLINSRNIKIINKDRNRAFYDPISDYINMPLATQFSSQDANSGTLLHEIIHWTAKRVDRDCKNYAFDIEERAMEELVAELGSMMLQIHFKIEGSFDKNNLAYIKSWKSATKGKSGDRFIYKACSLAEKACKFILGDKLNNSGEVEPDVKENAA